MPYMALDDRGIHSVSVAGIVVNPHGQVLLIQRRDNNRWEPPGGILELQETLEQGVVREVFEETGVAVRVERLTGVYKNLARGIVALVFRCAPVGGEPAPTTEAVAVAWKDRSEISELLAPAYAIRVDDAFEPNVATRSHDGTHILDEAEVGPV
jgi:8-oxo-dGTP diphosphatase